LKPREEDNAREGKDRDSNTRNTGHEFYREALTSEGNVVLKGGGGKQEGKKADSQIKKETAEGRIREKTWVYTS